MPPQDLAQFGLAQPDRRPSRSPPKDSALPDLKVGKTTAVSFSTYVQRADEPKIYLTGSAFQSGMDKQVKDLRDKKIVDFKEDDVTRIALRGPDGDVVLAKVDGTWKIEQPRRLPRRRQRGARAAVDGAQPARHRLRQRRAVRRRPGHLRPRHPAAPARPDRRGRHGDAPARRQGGRAGAVRQDRPTGRRRSSSASTCRAISARASTTCATRRC